MPLLFVTNSRLPWNGRTSAGLALSGARQTVLEKGPMLLHIKCRASWARKEHRKGAALITTDEGRPISCGFSNLAMSLKAFVAPRFLFLRRKAKPHLGFGSYIDPCSLLSRSVAVNSTNRYECLVNSTRTNNHSQGQLVVHERRTSQASYFL